MQKLNEFQFCIKRNNFSPSEIYRSTFILPKNELIIYLIVKLSKRNLFIFGLLANFFTSSLDKKPTISAYSRSTYAHLYIFIYKNFGRVMRDDYERETKESQTCKTGFPLVHVTSRITGFSCHDRDIIAKAFCARIHAFTRSTVAQIHLRFFLSINGYR